MITAWSASISCLIFFFLKLNGKLRLPREIEIAGCDIIKHGEAAYPPEAYEKGDEVPGSANDTPRFGDVENAAPDNNDRKAGVPWSKTKLNRSTIKKSPVTPLTFKKLKNDTDSMSSGSTSDHSRGNVKTEKLSGIVNTAFNDSVLGLGQNEAETNYQETHFNEPKSEKEKHASESMYENVLEMTKGNSHLTHLVEGDRTLDFNNSKESTMI